VRDAGADGSTAESRGPRVTFTSPLPASDPNTGELITEPTLRVACKVERALYVSAAAVDKATVKIALLKPHEGEAEDEKAEVWTDAPVNAVADDTFEAQFELRTLPNGPLQFRCVARDLATVPNTTTTKLRTLLDLGPKVEISKPNLASYALKSPVAIEFKIEASPVTSDDAEAEVDEIKLLVSGVPVDFEESMTTPGLYQANVDFDDRAQFPVPPESAQVTVTASNKRSPTVALRSVTKAIVIDGEGPSIVVKAPIDGQIVPYGENPLVVEVRDPSGVRASSLVANFNSGTLVLRDWKGVEPTFTHSFNPGSFGTQLTRLTVQISATDNVGNETMVPLVLKLDNLPPVISITPPLIREWRKNGNNLECSTLFDPVGADVPNDGQPLTGTAYFRALVEDKTNKPIVGPFDPSPSLTARASTTRRLSCLCSEMCRFRC
jgi:hypothetical protein